MVKIFAFVGDPSIKILSYPDNNGLQISISIFVLRMDKKNRSGRLSEQSVVNVSHIVSAYKLVGECCHVYLLDIKMPKKAMEFDYFYLQPLESTPSDPSAPWFYASPVGGHKLGGMARYVH